MAIILGNFEKSKQVKELNEKLQHEAKMKKVLELIEMAQPQAEKAYDIYDTYRYIKKIDAVFAHKLWDVLCISEIGNISINSYFSWRIGCNGNVHLSRYGVSFMNYKINEQLRETYNLSEEDLYRGKVLLRDYLTDFRVTENDLDKFAQDLENFITHFDQYAERFFSCVSNYKVK